MNGALHKSTRAGRAARPAFTLTELMVAVIVLIGVLLATSKIFSTTSKVTGMGEANASILQEAAAIERQMRLDVEHLAREGFFAIRGVAVPNAQRGRLINPSLPIDAKIRADQLVFFRHGVSSAQTYRVGSGGNKQAQGLLSRVYYGHGFQLGETAPPVDFSSGDSLGFDPASSQRVFPWVDGPVELRKFGYDDRNNRFEEGQSAEILEVSVEDARRWLFARQAIMMVDDDRGPRNAQGKTVYLDSVLTARSIFYDDPDLAITPEIRNGRIDAAATEMPELQEMLRLWGPWLNRGGGAEQFSLIAQQLVYYPRVEREAPSMHRVDQALTNSVMGSACSSVRIEWTYDVGTGYALGNGDPNSVGCPFEYLGFGFAGTSPGRTITQPWFGIPDAVTGATLYRDSTFAPETIVPDNIERYPVGGWNGVEVYEAVFGPNEAKSLDFNTDGCLVPEGQLVQNYYNIAYTPWPSAIRVTLTMHDPGTRLEHGREVQFIIRLPRRAADAS